MQEIRKYKLIGKTGLSVSPLVLGTMQFGWNANEEISHQILDTYIELGGDLIDTADCYSAWAPNNPGGVSEENHSVELQLSKSELAEISDVAALGTFSY